VNDGHSVPDLISALEKARTHKGQPTVVLFKTFKGKNFTEKYENKDWHGKPIGEGAQDVIAHLKTLITNEDIHLEPTKPIPVDLAHNSEPFSIPDRKLDYKLGDLIPSRMGYGNALKALGHHSKDIVVLDADTKTSTYSINFQKDHPQNFIECFIAEQNMISVATGLSTRGKITFSSSFAAFLSR
jgi:transketolase